MATDMLLVGDGPEILEFAALLKNAGRSPEIVNWGAPREEAFPSDPLLAEARAKARRVETIVEFVEGSLAGKREVYEALSGTQASLIIGSALRVGPTEIGSWLPDGDLVAGLSGLPPFSDRKRVELQRGLETSESSWKAARELLTSCGFEVEELGDHPGGVQLRLVCGIINEAVSLLSERGATAADIDTAMKLGTNYPEGPLRWADRIGLDRVMAVLEGLEREYREDRYRSMPLLRKHVLAGRLGERRGRGFYEYPQS